MVVAFEIRPVVEEAGAEKQLPLVGLASLLDFQLPHPHQHQTLLRYPRLEEEVVEEAVFELRPVVEEAGALLEPEVVLEAPVALGGPAGVTAQRFPP